MYQKIILVSVIGAVFTGCATTMSQEANTARAVALMKADFKSRGQATIDRLNQDPVQATCSAYADDKALPRDVAASLEKAQMATIKYPADGKLLGDWKRGEKIAQTGTGKQWSDNPSKPGGGNCYACHELTKAELSYGNIGPSLYRFGKIRGYSPEIQKYAYGKVYNAQAYAACSRMPRFGHNGILTEAQIKDVTALLLDPDSPVNK